MGEENDIQMHEALASILSRNPKQPREEPEVANNIGQQLLHMELTSAPLSIRRRIRDVVATLRPTRILEVGSGIGHLSAWLLDLWERQSKTPESYELVESGARFSVILTRLLQRYDAADWARVTVGGFEQLAAESTAWQAAAATAVSQTAVASLGDSPLLVPADLIIIDVGESSQSACIEAALPLLSNAGVLLTIEPEVPIGEVDAADVAAQAQIVSFQAWIDLIRQLSDSHHLAFQPLTGGTLVAVSGR